MDWQFDGIPLHPLFVHAVVVLVPAAALLTVLHAVWPAAARKLTWITPAVALGGLVSVPLATQAGEWLEHRTAETRLVETHTEMGDHLLPWAILLFAAAVSVWLWQWQLRRRTTNRALRIALTALIAVGATAIAVVAVVEVVLIGDGGARAVWRG